MADKAEKRGLDMGPILLGVDGQTGRAFSQASWSDVHNVAQRQGLSMDDRDLASSLAFGDEVRAGVPDGYDPKRLDQCGWALILPEVTTAAGQRRQDEQLKALAPLISHRRQQCGDLYRAIRGFDGIRPGEGPIEFMDRHSIPFGSPYPPDFPYYILLLGSPEEISWSFQNTLAQTYAVGRLSFETDELEALGNYAKSVVESETAGPAPREGDGPPTLSLVGVGNPGDGATAVLESLLIPALRDLLGLEAARLGWTLRASEAGEATSGYLRDQLFGEGRGDVVFTGSHGLFLPNTAPTFGTDFGALLGNEWVNQGPYSESPVSPEWLVSARGLISDKEADLRGMISFHLGCFTAGCGRLSTYDLGPNGLPVYPGPGSEPKEALLDEAIVSPLPEAMLGLRKGALATIGHVDKAWLTSCLTPGSRTANASTLHEQHIMLTLRSLMMGYPVGHAVAPLRGYWANAASNLTRLQRRLHPQARPSDELAQWWLAEQDARAFAVLGDPAVHTPRAPSNTPREDPLR